VVAPANTVDPVIQDRVVKIENYTLPRAFADMLLARVHVALDEGALLDAAKLLSTLVMSNRVVEHMAFGTEVLRCVRVLFERSWPPDAPVGAQTMERFADAFFGETKSDLALWSLVQMRMVMQDFKEAYVLLQDRLLDRQVLRSSYRFLAAMLAHRVWSSERDVRTVSRAEFAASVPNEGEPRPALDVSAPPADWLRACLFLLFDLITPKAHVVDQSVPVPAVNDPPPPSSSSSSSSSSPNSRSVDVFSVRPASAPSQPQPQPQPQAAARKHVWPLKPYAGQLETTVECAAVELLSTLYESAGDTVTAESLLRRVVDAQSNNVSALTLLLSFWQRHSELANDQQPIIALTRRVFDLDPSNDVVFGQVRRLCGDEGPVLVGDRCDVVSIALARVIAVPDDAASWLWLVRLSTHWNASLQLLYARYTAKDTRVVRSDALEAYRKAHRQYQRFWEAMWERIAAALPAPPRLRSTTTPERDYYLLLYQCTFADSIAGCSKVASAFVRAAKAILHPLDTDMALYVRTLERVRLEAIQAPTS
jgi:hypothetical protein